MKYSKVKKRNFFNFLSIATTDRQLQISLSLLFAIVGIFLCFLAAILPHIDVILVTLTQVDMKEIKPEDLKIKDLTLNHSEKIMFIGIFFVILSSYNNLITGFIRLINGWKEFRQPGKINVNIKVEKDTGVKITGESGN